MARLKLIDVWFLFGFMTCFAIFLLHIFFEVINPELGRKKHPLPSNGGEKNGGKTQRKGGWVMEKGLKANLQEKFLCGKRRHNRLKRLAQVMVPLFTLLFVISYWLSATMQSSNL